jgi:hypothetical protein
LLSSLYSFLMLLLFVHRIAAVVGIVSLLPVH